ncbi:MAG: type II toxin-antitoxin system ParD family antitoxin [Rhodospirillales bacterium]|nr:type II toxin-antitoxin system ParD family antitoxin [Rhodospirillales bacterium]
MAKTTSFNLGDHFEQFIASQIKSGRYGNASEVVRASLRMMEQEEQKLEALRQALIDGENSGPSTPLDMVEIRQNAKKKAGLAP